jgi:hypothetical protein
MGVFRSALAIAIALWATVFAATASAVPGIHLDSLPPYGQAGFVQGTVSGVDFSQYAVAIDIKIDGGGWWAKPSNDRRTVSIQSDGSFSADIGTDGLDAQAAIYTAALVPKVAFLPQSMSLDKYPAAMSSVAVDSRQRYNRVIQFAGQSWGVKDGPMPVGPGPNYFANDAQNVWVDGNGLHLTVQQRNGQWRCSEVVLLDSKGYGTYSFQTNTRNDLLDANAVFGGFTWDEYGDEGRIGNWPYREIDFEDSRWADPLSSLNTQGVVQKFDTPGNRHRYALPDLSANPDLTRILTWEPDQIRFTALHGHYPADNFPPASVIDDWTYLHDPAASHIVPAQGRENFRFNLYLYQQPPAQGQTVEVVVNDFSFIMVPGALRWTASHDGAWTDADWAGPPPAIPGSANGVVIDSPHAVGVSGAQQARWIAVSQGGTLALSATSSLAVSRTVTLSEGGTLSLASGAGLNAAELILTGGRISGSGTLTSSVTVSSGTIEVPASTTLLLDGKLSSYGLLCKSGSGTLELRGGNYQSNSNIAVLEGKLKYNFDGADSSNVLSDSVITILADATVELGGNLSGMGNAVMGANILNNSFSGVLVSGKNQQCQSIVGSGNTTLLPGSELSTHVLWQDSLTFSGGSKLTLMPSEGNSLFGPSVMLYTTATSGGLSTSESASVPEPSSLFLLFAAMGIAGIVLIRGRARTIGLT